MKLKLVRGCICGSLTADDIEEIHMTDKERSEVCNKIGDWIKENPDQLNYVMQALIPELGDYKCDSEPCECCGDFVETYTWEI